MGFKHMKTAKEWFNEEYYNISDTSPITFGEIVKRIQLDAMKEGMRRAAEIGMNKSPMPRPPDDMTTLEKRTTIVNAILTAAEQLTEKDL